MAVEEAHIWVAKQLYVVCGVTTAIQCDVRKHHKYSWSTISTYWQRNIFWFHAWSCVKENRNLPNSASEIPRELGYSELRHTIIMFLENLCSLLRIPRSPLPETHKLRERTRDWKKAVKISVNLDKWLHSWHNYMGISEHASQAYLLFTCC